MKGKHSPTHVPSTQKVTHNNAYLSLQWAWDSEGMARPNKQIKKVETVTTKVCFSYNNMFIVSVC